MPLVITEFGAEAARRGPVEQRGSEEFQRRFVLDHLAVHASKRYIYGSINWALRDFRVDPTWQGGASPPGPRRRGTTRRSSTRPTLASSPTSRWQAPWPQDTAVMRCAAVTARPLLLPPPRLARRVAGCGSTTARRSSDDSDTRAVAFSCLTEERASTPAWTATTRSPSDGRPDPRISFYLTAGEAEAAPVRGRRGGRGADRRRAAVRRARDHRGVRGPAREDRELPGGPVGLRPARQVATASVAVAPARTSKTPSLRPCRKRALGHHHRDELASSPSASWNVLPTAPIVPFTATAMSRGWRSPPLTRPTTWVGHEAGCSDPRSRYSDASASRRRAAAPGGRRGLSDQLLVGADPVDPAGAVGPGAEQPVVAVEDLCALALELLGRDAQRARTCRASGCAASVALLHLVAERRLAVHLDLGVEVQHVEDRGQDVDRLDVRVVDLALLLARAP